MIMALFYPDPSRQPHGKRPFISNRERCRYQSQLDNTQSEAWRGYQHNKAITSLTGQSAATAGSEWQSAQVIREWVAEW